MTSGDTPAPTEAMAVEPFTRQHWEDTPLGQALTNRRGQAAGDFKDPQHQGQRGCDWDAGFIAACRIAEEQARLTASAHDGSGRGVREAATEVLEGWDNAHGDATMDERMETLRKSLTCPTPEPDPREALNKALEFACLAIAFIGRDRGTDRIDTTLDGLCEEARALEGLCRATLTTADPVSAE